MDFNALQLRNTSGHSFTFRKPHQSRNGTPIMYSFGQSPTISTHPNPTHRHSMIQQSSSTWVPEQNSPTDPPGKRRCMGNEDSIISENFMATSNTNSLRPSSVTIHSNRSGGLWSGTQFDFSNLTTNPDLFLQKNFDELSMPNFDTEVQDFSQGFAGEDENTPIIDLRHSNDLLPNQGQTNEGHDSSRRLSEAYSVQSNGIWPDLSAQDDAPPSDTPYASDYEGWGNLDMTTNPPPLSPAASSQHSNVDGFRSTGVSRVSPVSQNVRSSPYSLPQEGSRLKRWSTGTYTAPTTTPLGTRNHNPAPNRYSAYATMTPRYNPHHSLPAYLPTYSNNILDAFPPPPQNVLYSQPNVMQTNGSGLFPTANAHQQFEIPRPLPSQGPHGLFRLLQSNADRYSGCSSHLADLSDPPDLYSSLQNEPSDPPESDMHPSDPDMIPHEQELRFSGDLYTPKWVRGHGNKREGWCGLCKPGRWLVLKNSAYWYDKSFTHGVSHATGAAFQGPQETRRTEGNLDVWEGLCGSCGEWVALVSSKKKGTTWFRHAYKCHTHAKVRDGPKRRREATNNNRDSTISATSVASSHYVTETEDADQKPRQEQFATSDNYNLERESTPRPEAPYGVNLSGQKVVSSLADFAGLI